METEQRSFGERAASRLYNVGFRVGRLLTRVYGSLFTGFVEGVKSRLTPANAAPPTDKRRGTAS